MKIYKLLASLIMFIGLQANANMITINVDNTSVTVGNRVNVSLFASFTDSVDIIDFDFIFDQNLFSFVDSSESTSLANDGFFNFFTAVPNMKGLGLGYVINQQYMLASFEKAFSSSSIIMKGILHLYNLHNLTDISKQFKRSLKTIIFNLKITKFYYFNYIMNKMKRGCLQL